MMPQTLTVAVVIKCYRKNFMSDKLPHAHKHTHTHTYIQNTHSQINTSTQKHTFTHTHEMMPNSFWKFRFSDLKNVEPTTHDAGFFNNCIKNQFQVGKLNGNRNPMGKYLGYAQIKINETNDSRSNNKFLSFFILVLWRFYLIGKMKTISENSP